MNLWFAMNVLRWLGGLFGAGWMIGLFLQNPTRLEGWIPGLFGLVAATVLGEWSHDRWKEATHPARGGVEVLLPAAAALDMLDLLRRYSDRLTLTLQHDETLTPGARDILRRYQQRADTSASILAEQIRREDVV